MKKNMLILNNDPTIQDKIISAGAKIFMAQSAIEIEPSEDSNGYYDRDSLAKCDKKNKIWPKNVGRLCLRRNIMVYQDVPLH